MACIILKLVSFDFLSANCKIVVQQVQQQVLIYSVSFNCLYLKSLVILSLVSNIIPIIFDIAIISGPVPSDHCHIICKQLNQYSLLYNLHSLVNLFRLVHFSYEICSKIIYNVYYFFRPLKVYNY